MKTPKDLRKAYYEYSQADNETCMVVALRELKKVSRKYGKDWKDVVSEQRQIDALWAGQDNS